MPKGSVTIYTSKELIAKRKALWEKNVNQAGVDPLDEDADFINRIVDWLQRFPIAADALTKEWKKNPELLIELFFVIVDKDQNTVPFFLNDVQREFRDIINQALDDYRKGKRNHLKFLLLKGRQQGFTQFITALQLAYALVTKNFGGFTLADTAENTETIFSDKAKFPFDNLPEFLKPTQKYNNRRELHFQKPNAKGLNSRMRVATAGNEEVGRSKTLNFFHGSEVAFWSDLSKILKGLGEALTKNCIVVLETTANGFNAYKQLWDDDNNTYEKVFFAWWKTKEYRLPFESKEARADFVKRLNAAKESEDAQTRNWVYWRIKWLMETEGIELEQGYWYYNKWCDLHEDIKQEYPCSPNEAFMSTGQNYFSVEILTKRQAEVRRQSEEDGECVARGYFEFEYTTDRRTKDKTVDTQTINWIDDPQGYIKIFRESEPYVGYVMGGDTATDGSDRNVAQVIDTTGEQMACLTVENDEDFFADQAFCLGWYYNTALIAPEVNHSTHPTKVLMSRGYPNLYTRGKKEDPLSKGQKPQARYGFRTDQNNRPSMLGLLRTLVRDHPEKVHDLDTIDEMLSFIRDDKGKPQAEEGMHDDRVMAYAIALQVASLQAAEEKPPARELEGFYTEAELEDLGYSRYEIRGYMEGRLTLYEKGVPQ